MSTNDTVAQLVRQVERQHRSKPALKDLNGRCATYGELQARSNRLANAILGAGVRPGDRVAYASRNCLEYFELDFALVKAGLTKVPLYTRLSGEELVRCLRIAEARLVLADTETAARIDEAYGDDADRPIGVVLGKRPGWHPYEEWLAKASSVDPDTPVGPDDIYHIRFSSGSTGPPKGIAISHRGARSAILGNLWVFALEAGQRAPHTLQQAPLVFAGGWSVMPTFLMGGTSVVVDEFDPELMLRSIVDERINWMFAVPTMLRRFAELGADLEELRSSTLTCLMYAGEPAPVETLERLLEYTDSLVQCWGQTEAPASTTWLGRVDHHHQHLLGSIGQPIPGVEFAVLNGTAPALPDTELEAGEIILRSPTIASFLIGAEEEYASRRLEGGWWRTGDVGRIDEEGYLYLEGRLSEVIITGGTNVHPTEIEQVLQRRDDVIEAVVVGVPDPRWGETPAALLSAPQMTDDHLDDLESWLVGQISRFKRPRHIFVISEPLPRSSPEAKPSRGSIKEQVRRWVERGDVPAGVRHLRKE